MTHPEKLAGLGPKSLQMLQAIGIESTSAFLAADVYLLYAQLKARFPATSLNMLYAMIGAQENRHWTSVKQERRTEILLKLDQMGLAPRKKLKCGVQHSNPALVGRKSGAPELPDAEFCTNRDKKMPAHWPASVFRCLCFAGYRLQAAYPRHDRGGIADIAFKHLRRCMRFIIATRTVTVHFGRQIGLGRIR